VTQMVSAERAAALRNKCLNLAKTCRSGSGSASERTSQSRQLMSPVGTKRTYRDVCYLIAFGAKAAISQRLPNKRNL
jgi:hypothetical protein